MRSSTSAEADGSCGAKFGSLTTGSARLRATHNPCGAHYCCLYCTTFYCHGHAALDTRSVTQSNGYSYHPTCESRGGNEVLGCGLANVRGTDGHTTKNNDHNRDGKDRVEVTRWDRGRKDERHGLGPPLVPPSRPLPSHHCSGGTQRVDPQEVAMNNDGGPTGEEGRRPPRQKKKPRGKPYSPEEGTSALRRRTGGIRLAGFSPTSATRRIATSPPAATGLVTAMMRTRVVGGMSVMLMGMLGAG